MPTLREWTHEKSRHVLQTSRRIQAEALGAALGQYPRTMKRNSRSKRAVSSSQAALAQGKTHSQAKEMLRALAYYLYWLAPKRDTVIVYGWPDFEDSALALQEALGETYLSKIIFFVSKKHEEQPFLLGPKTLIVRKDSLRGLFYFVTARYVLFTHRCFMQRFPPNVT